MKIMVFPREDQNPYQHLLYGEMERLGTRIDYLGRLTPSHTLNLLLLPLEVAARRVGGARLLHLHWVFGFGFPGSYRFPWLRRVAQLWFVLWLRVTGLFGVRLVWTAHNVLPHAPVFADDMAARCTLVARSDLVLAHAQSALVALASFGAVPCRSAVIPHGPLAPVVLSAPLRIPGAGDGPRQILFFGKVLEYKGVEDLLASFAMLPADTPVRLTVAGECGDQALRKRLVALARLCGERVELHLERVPDDRIASLITSADVVALPFRRVTTSGSAMLALGYGRPLIVPELAALTDLPRRAIFSYDGTRSALSSVLDQAARVHSVVLAEMSAAARAFAAVPTWPEIAAKTIDEMSSVLSDEFTSYDQMDKPTVQQNHSKVGN